MKLFFSSSSSSVCAQCRTKASPIDFQPPFNTYITHHRFLVVTVDCRLSWTKHITMWKTEPPSFVHILRFVAGMRWGPSELFFGGFLCYSLPVILNFPISCLRTLESMQVEALWVCVGLPRCTSTVGTIAEACVFSGCTPFVKLLCVYLLCLTWHARHSVLILPTTCLTRSLVTAVSHH